MISVGSVIGGRFRVDEILGAGGMGIVVAATHTELGHRVAIKLLRDEMVQSPTIVERFLREARSVAGLRTEHVCRVSDVGRLDSGAPYIVMERLDGVDLQRAVAKQALPSTTAVEYVLQACVALAEAHAAGIIHRDLKPANLFVTRRLDGGPLVKVLDFGIAKALAETGAHLTHQSAMGSPGYMSPEQIQSARDVDVRTDLWSLGVTLYQLLSARMPFPGATQTEIAVRVATDPPDPLDVPPGLHEVVWKCLEKSPVRRYASVGELMTALVPFGGPAARQHLGLAATLGGASAGFAGVPPSTVPAVTTGAPTQPASLPGTQPGTGPEPPQRRRWPLLVVSLALALVLGGGFAAMVYLRRPGVASVPAATRDAPAAMPAMPASVADAAVREPVPDHRDPWASAPGDAGAGNLDAAALGDTALDAGVAPTSDHPTGRRRKTSPGSTASRASSRPVRRR